MQALNIPKITIPYHMEKHFINRHSLEEQEERPQFWMRVVRCHTSAVHRQIHKTCLIWPGRIGCRCSTPRACSIGAASWGLLYSKTLLKWPISKSFDPRTGTQCTYSILGSRPKIPLTCSESSIWGRYSPFFDLWRNTKPNLVDYQIFGLRVKFWPN